MRAEELRTASERKLYVASLVVSLVIWIVLVVTIVGLIYGLLIGFFIFAAHALMIAYIKGNAVRISETQLPGIYRKVVEASRKLGLETAPEAYVMQAGGMLNAFATKFFSRNFIVIYSDLLEACDENGREMDMIIGHEIGHLALGHLKRLWLLTPSYVVPWLGTAYSRAREYSCDLCGHEVVGELEPAVKGLTVLAAGGKYGRQVNIDDFVRQAQDTAGFWTSVYELNATHPYLPKRIAALINQRTPGTVPAVKRNTFAYPLAPLFAFGTGAGAGPLVMVAIIAILAAIAIPQFAVFKAKAEQAAMHGVLKEMNSAAHKYHDKKGSWPCSMADLRLTKTAELAKAKKWQFEVSCEGQALAGIIYRGKDGKRHYEAIYFESGEIESGTLKD